MRNRWGGSRFGQQLFFYASFASGYHAWYGLRHFHWCDVLRWAVLASSNSRGCFRLDWNQAEPCVVNSGLSATISVDRLCL